MYIAIEGEGYVNTIAKHRKKRGVFTIYIGYSPGVGKTFEMLSNAIELFQSNVYINSIFKNPYYAI